MYLSALSLFYSFLRLQHCNTQHWQSKCNAILLHQMLLQLQPAVLTAKLACGGGSKRNNKLRTFKFVFFIIYFKQFYISNGLLWACKLHNAIFITCRLLRRHSLTLPPSFFSLTCTLGIGKFSNNYWSIHRCCY